MPRSAGGSHRARPRSSARTHRGRLAAWGRTSSGGGGEGCFGGWRAWPSIAVAAAAKQCFGSPFVLGCSGLRVCHGRHRPALPVPRADVFFGGFVASTALRAGDTQANLYSPGHQPISPSRRSPYACLPSHPALRIHGMPTYIHTCVHTYIHTHMDTHASTASAYPQWDWPGTNKHFCSTRANKPSSLSCCSLRDKRGFDAWIGYPYLSCPILCSHHHHAALTHAPLGVGPQATRPPLLLLRLPPPPLPSPVPRVAGRRLSTRGERRAAAPGEREARQTGGRRAWGKGGGGGRPPAVGRRALTAAGSALLGHVPAVPASRADRPRIGLFSEVMDTATSSSHCRPIRSRSGLDPGPERDRSRLATFNGTSELRPS